MFKTVTLKSRGAPPGGATEGLCPGERGFPPHGGCFRKDSRKREGLELGEGPLALWGARRSTTYPRLQAAHIRARLVAMQRAAVEAPEWHCNQVMTVTLTTK